MTNEFMPPVQLTMAPLVVQVMVYGFLVTGLYADTAVLA